MSRARLWSLVGKRGSGDGYGWCLAGCSATIYELLEPAGQDLAKPRPLFTPATGHPPSLHRPLLHNLLIFFVRFLFRFALTDNMSALSGSSHSVWSSTPRVLWSWVAHPPTTNTTAPPILASS